MGAAVNTTAELVSFDVSPSLPFTVETSTMVGCVHRPAGEPRAILVCWPGRLSYCPELLGVRQCSGV